MSKEDQEVMNPDQPDSSHELQTTGAAAKEYAEIQAASVMARKFPRDEATCFAKLMHSARRPSFAEDATYEFPRGTKEDGTKNIVKGPSVNLAREAKRCWGNIRSGLRIIRDDAASRLIRAECWDLETGAYVYAEDDFKKLIQRKTKEGTTVWVPADERDLRELTNRRGAILERNCILHMMPKDLIEDALFVCGETLADRAAKDPDAARKRLIVTFAEFNVTPELIAKKLGHSLSEASPQELVELQNICTSIKDGNSTWKEYVSGTDEPAEGEKKATEKQTTKGASVRDKITGPAVRITVPMKTTDSVATKVHDEAPAIDLNVVAVAEHSERIAQATTLDGVETARGEADLDKRLSPEGQLALDKVYNVRVTQLKPKEKPSPGKTKK